MMKYKVPLPPTCIKWVWLGCLVGTMALPISLQAQQTNERNRAQTGKSPRQMIFRGVVIDDEGMPVVGANVRVKGNKTLGTTTDVNGEFRLQLTVGNHTLVFSYIGMLTQEVRATGSNRITVRLQPDANELGEAIVTGIYTRKAESFTGSASTYKQQELKAVGNQNILQSLSALDPSFLITDNNLMGSNPNAALDISINGKTSITGLSDTYGSNPDQPLFILDGFETSLQRISDLSMDRVESITILKDAASTAIYGSKAANGVVVVETKKPEAGRLRFTYNGNYAVGWADLSDYNLMDASEKLRFEKLAGYYGKLDADGEIIQDSYRDLYYSRLRNVVAGLDSYWMNEPLRTAFSHDHSFNAEGGDSAFRYGLTFRYRNAEGVMKLSDRDNVDGTVNLTYRVDKFRFSNQTNVYYTDISNNVVSFSDFSRANPYYAKYDANGDIYKVMDSYSQNATTQYVYNPLWDFRQKSKSGGNELTLNNNFNVEFNPIDRLRVIGKFGFTTTNSKSEVFKSPFSSEFTGTEQLKRGTYNHTSDNATSYDGSLYASFGDMIGKHTYTLIGGTQFTENRSKSESYSARGYITDQFSNPNFSTGYPDGGKPSSTIVKQRSASFYLNGNYAYDMRYLLDFNVRSDGASVFGVNNPFSTTYSLGVAWNLHNESFLKGSKAVSQLKLRYSYGNPGDQNINAKIANNVYTYYTQYQNMFGLAAIVNQWGNKNLKYQRTRTHNFGLTSAFFENRLKLTVDYTLRNSDPILLSVSQPTSTGASTVPMNIGATRNKSLSVTLNYDAIRNRDWLWMINVNALHTRTRYDKIGDILEKLNQDGRANQTLLRYYDGASSSALWAVRSLGIDPMTGNEVFVKKNGSYTFKWDSNDEVEVGDSTPDLQGNFGSTVRYKGFSLLVNFRYRIGGQIALNTLLNKVENIDDISVKYNQDKRALHDRWQKPGDKALFKRIDDTSKTNLSSRFIADENTLQCQSISLGYESTTAEWVKKMGVSSLTFRVYMNDIFRLSTVKEERGLDYPFQRSVSASLGLRF